MNFEEITKRLENISESLKDENLGLEQSISLFEEANELSKQAYKILSESNGKVKILSKELEELDFDKL